MSNYRRLISYIYAYEGEAKGRNIGFAKLESRGGQCRISVSVKKVYVGSGGLEVYLMAPEKEIGLGSIFVRGGAGEFRASVAVDNVAESGVPMDMCFGLTIHEPGDSWRAYTTIWEDAVPRAAEVELADVTWENTRASSPEEEIRQKAEIVAKEVDREIALNQKKEEETTEPKTSPEQPEETLSESEQENELPKPPAPVIQDESGKLDLEDPKLLERLEQEEQESMNPGDLWDSFRKQYPKIQAFDCPGGCEILTIKPQDIGLLPREIWVYGNNSFLLHGYYNYRYLILARVELPQEGTSRYLLGVPGHYYSNEKYMASMFGFPHFVLARKQPSQDGRFGYWYTHIHLDHSGRL